MILLGRESLVNVVLAQNDGYALMVRALGGAFYNLYEFRTNTTTTWTSEDTLENQVWTHMMTVFNGVDRRIYINGELDPRVDTSPPTNVESTIHPVTIGHRFAQDRWFGGRIDEVRILDKSKSADWVKAQFKSQADSYVQFLDEETQAESFISLNVSLNKPAEKDLVIPLSVSQQSTVSKADYEPIGSIGGLYQQEKHKPLLLLIFTLIQVSRLTRP